MNLKIYRELSGNTDKNYVSNLDKLFVGKCLITVYSMKCIMTTTITITIISVWEC